jgi:hypothetical protein
MDLMRIIVLNENIKKCYLYCKPVIKKTPYILSKHSKQLRKMRLKYITEAIMINTIFWYMMLYCLLDSTSDVEGPPVSTFKLYVSLLPWDIEDIGKVHTGFWWRTLFDESY